MTPKDYLSRAYALDRKAAMLISKACKLRENLYGRGISYDSDKVKSTCSGDLSGVIAKVDEYERKADEVIAELVEKRLEIEAVISAVPDEVQREVLERRYLLYQSWETYFDKRTGERVIGIDESMNYSARQIYRFHGEALIWIKSHVSKCQ